MLWLITEKLKIYINIVNNRDNKNIDCNDDDSYPPRPQVFRFERETPVTGDEARGPSVLCAQRERESETPGNETGLL